jgi:hypothetical protein
MFYTVLFYCVLLYCILYCFTVYCISLLYTALFCYIVPVKYLDTPIHSRVFLHAKVCKAVIKAKGG